MEASVILQVVAVRCQERGAASPCLPYLLQGSTMLPNVIAPLVIRAKVTLMDDTSRGLEVPREHTTRCTPLS